MAVGPELTKENDDLVDSPDHGLEWPRRRVFDDLAFLAGGAVLDEPLQNGILVCQITWKVSLL
jgi:hypothetical protein